MKITRPIITLMILIASLSIVGAQDEPLRIVGTTTQAYDVLEILADGTPEGAVEIIGLMGPGVDPHLYEPTGGDQEDIFNADMLVYSGLHLEGKFSEIFEKLGERGIRSYAMAEVVEDAGFIVDAFDVDGTILTGTPDPHYWFDPRNWEMTVLDLAEELAEMDEANADIYLSNAEAYSEDLRLLFEWADAGMRSVPEELRYLVTSHDAFQYFGDAFGWEMRAIQGISTADETGVGDIQETVNFVIDSEIPVVFIESTIPIDTIEAVQEAVADTGGNVALGKRELFSDAMGERDSFGGTYIGMIAHNVYTILQSYEDAGVEVDIPEFPSDLEPQPPDEMFE